MGEIKEASVGWKEAVKGDASKSIAEVNYDEVKIDNGWSAKWGQLYLQGKNRQDIGPAI